MSGGELIGVINVHHCEPHHHSSDEVALVTFIGEQMGGLIGRHKLADQSMSAVDVYKRQVCMECGFVFCLLALAIALATCSPS